MPTKFSVGDRVIVTNYDVLENINLNGYYGHVEDVVPSRPTGRSIISVVLQGCTPDAPDRTCFDEKRIRCNPYPFHESELDHAD
jgi:hypothetical protein